MELTPPSTDAVVERARAEDGWLHFDAERETYPTPVASIGLIVMANDVWIADEMRTFLPSDGVGLHINRIPLPPQLTASAGKALAKDIVRVAELILPDEHLDVLAFGTTGGTITIGEEIVLGLLKEARPEVKHTTPITAVVEAFRTMGARRLAVLTPYPADVNPLISAYFAERGFEIVVCGSFHGTGDPDFVRVSVDSIREAACELARAGAVDAIFVSCTALRVSPVLEAIEAETGLPVLTSTQALAWHSLQLSGNYEPLSGRGHLFTLPGPVGE